MYTSELIYQGNLRANATHLQSGTTIETDAPIDNNGKGERFSPTDLMATSLGSCALTVMGIEANRMGVNIDGSSVQVKKTMGINPRRVIKTEVNMKIVHKGCDSLQEAKLIETGLNCPVSKSLHPELVQDFQFQFTELK